jgi:hypothetical protein
LRKDGGRDGGGGGRAERSGVGIGGESERKRLGNT